MIVIESRVESPLWRRLLSWTAVFVAGQRRILAKTGLLWYTFAVFVALPSVITTSYLLLVASREYVSEARFSIRAATETPNAAPPSDLMAMVSSFAGVRSTGQDAFMVLDYIRSRSIIDDLGGRDLLVGIYAKPSIDWLSRLKANGSMEDLWDYWRSKVSAVIDTQSNIVTLRVRAYSPEDAHALAIRILAQSEHLINEVSERSRRDAVVRAEAEVDAAIKKLAVIRQELLRFRNQTTSIDPLQSAKSLSETLTQLTRDKMGLENSREAVRKQLDSNSPTVRALDTQINALAIQIGQVQSRLAGGGGEEATIATQLGEYEKLELQNQFAEKLFSITQAAFQKAQIEQDRQQLYLATIARPGVPEEATYPRPIVGTAIVFALCMAIWSMVALVAASIADHLG